jgi:multiple sugar transport system substrate-binding protein
MKRIHRLRLIPVILVVLSAAVPAARGLAAPAAAPAHRAAAAGVTLRFADFLGASGRQLARQIILPAFNKEYPGVTVNFEPIPDTRVKSVTEIAAGTAPDIFNLGDGDEVWYQAKGAIKDLAPYAQKDNFSFSQYVPGSLLFGKAGSRQYALPKDYSPLAIYYNKDMFKAAGVPLPANNWTWNDFLQDAIKLNKSGIYGASLPGNWARAVDAVVRSMGARLASTDGKKIVGYMDSAATVKAVQWWIDLFNKYKIAPTPTQASALNVGDLFASGKAAMNLTGVWPSLGASGYPHTLKFNWGVAPLPSGTVHANAICWAGFVMSQSTKHPQQAWGLIKYMSGPVGDTAWAQNGLPSVKAVADRMHMTATTEDVFLKEASLPYAALVPEDAQGPNSAEAVGGTLTEGLNLLLNTPGVSVQQVLTIEAKKGQKAVDAYYAQ